MISQKCKGARELLSEDIERFRCIESAFRDSCLRWGYQEVKTPTLEYLHLFTSAGTLSPSMLNRVYSFLDWDGWSGERVVLRPDGTIPVVRLFNENLPHLSVAKLFYVTSVFAFEETGTENRERWQCGVELIGENEVTTDLEMLVLALEILTRLNPGKIKLQLSHAGILRALIKDLNLGVEEQGKVLSEIRDGNWGALRSAGAENTDARALISVLLGLKGSSSGFLHNLKALPHISADFKAQLNSFSKLAGALDAMEYEYEIDMTSTRGFEYYTGVCFQFLLKNRKVGGGGRYDDLVRIMGGENKPACGFALYMDSLMNVVNVQPSTNQDRRVLIRCEATAPRAVKRCFQLAQSLHDAGNIADVDFNGRPGNHEFIVTIEKQAPYMTVINQGTTRKTKCSSIAEVIGFIGGRAVGRAKRSARKAD